MANRLLLDAKYLELAEMWGKLSVAERKKVGCIVVKDNQIISDGYNGTPSGFDNKCESLIQKTFDNSTEEYSLIEDGFYIKGIGLAEKNATKPEVLHAESNALMKLAISTQSSKDATVYVTLSPCFECSKLIIQAQIKRVVFSEKYRVTDGLDLLKKAGIRVDQLININNEYNIAPY